MSPPKRSWSQAKLTQKEWSREIKFWGLAWCRRLGFRRIVSTPRYRTSRSSIYHNRSCPVYELAPTAALSARFHTPPVATRLDLVICLQMVQQLPDVFQQRSNDCVSGVVSVERAPSRGSHLELRSLPRNAQNPNSSRVELGIGLRGYHSWVEPQERKGRWNRWSANLFVASAIRAAKSAMATGCTNRLVPHNKLEWED